MSEVSEPSGVPLDEVYGQYLGRIAYHGYGEMVGGRSVHDEPLPSWADQRPRVQAAWVRAALLVAARVREDVGRDESDRMPEGARLAVDRLDADEAPWLDTMSEETGGGSDQR